MISFKEYLTEEKNLHLEHLNDAVLNGGVEGTRTAIGYIQALRDALSGNVKKKVTTSLKLDGSPALYCGTNPENGKFFVAKKGIFNKDPKIYYTNADIDADTSGDLNEKLKLALKHLPSLGIKGVIQGDFLFSKSDLKTQNIEGESYITFHPNTIVYAVPSNTPLAKEIRGSEIGICFHTVYTGDKIENMQAQFNVEIVSKLKKSSKVWVIGATLPDFSGTVTMTKDETDLVTSKLSELGKLFRQTRKETFSGISDNPELLMRIKTFNNSRIRVGESITDPSKHVSDLIRYLNDYYDKEIDKRKTEAGKNKQREVKADMMSYFDKTPKSQIVNIFTIMNLLDDCKHVLIRKLNSLVALNTFLLTPEGFRVTGQEGFVVADHLGKNALKLVDRLEFSRANFGGALRGWEKK